MRAEFYKWIPAKATTAEVVDLMRTQLDLYGSAVLRGRRTAARRTLASLMTQIPTGFQAVRIPEPSNADVTTVLVWRDGDQPPAFWSEEGPL